LNLTVVLALEVLLLALAANGAPILGKRLLGERWSLPLDGGLRFVDGRPLLGPSKTVRGLVLSLVACLLVALLLGYPWVLGLKFGAASMAGDAVSSFLKRRLDIPSSGRFLGLDQIPEILLPLWLCRTELGLDLGSIVVLILLFAVGSLLLSRVMFWLGVRERPY
jgi:CDP-2,3-bis-(O-geranylgeranyl)-sn-glycerol synthase